MTNRNPDLHDRFIEEQRSGENIDVFDDFEAFHKPGESPFRSGCDSDAKHVNHLRNRCAEHRLDSESSSSLPRLRICSNTQGTSPVG